jgi:hypothetical protein
VTLDPLVYLGASSPTGSLAYVRLEQLGRSSIKALGLKFNAAEKEVDKRRSLPDKDRQGPSCILQSGSSAITPPVCALLIQV